MPPAEKKLSFYLEESLSGELLRGSVLFLGTSPTGKGYPHIANFSCTPQTSDPKVAKPSGGGMCTPPTPAYLWFLSIGTRLFR